MSISASTDLVVAPVMKGRQELVSAAEVEAWLDEVSSGEKLFSSVVGYQSYGANSDLAMFGSGAIGLAAGTGGGSAFMTADWAVNSFGLLWVGAIVSGSLIGILAGFVGAKILQRKGQVKWDQVFSVQRLGFKRWLNARYGLVVSNATLDKLVRGILLGFREASFSDVSGSDWKFEFSQDGSVLAVVPVDSVEDREKRVSAVKFVVEVELPGEAGSLLASIRSRLNVLQSLSLTVESSHAVKRVEEDVRQAIVSFRKFETLGAEVKGSVQLVSVFSVLNDELRGMVDAEVMAVENDMEVQRTYLKSRQLDAGVVPGLNLNVLVEKNVVKVEVDNV